MCLVGIGAIQALWVVDYLGNLVGAPITGVTDYMFESQHSAFLRGLSFFHGWLPFLLAFLVWKLGYDRRALAAWTGLAFALLLICFFFMPPPRPDPGLTPVNINYVWGLTDDLPQHWVSPAVWLAGLMFGLPFLIYAPTHFLLARIMPEATRKRPKRQA